MTSMSNHCLEDWNVTVWLNCKYRFAKPIYILNTPKAAPGTLLQFTELALFMCVVLLTLIMYFSFSFMMIFFYCFSIQQVRSPPAFMLSTDSLLPNNRFAFRERTDHY